MFFIKLSVCSLLVFGAVGQRSPLVTITQGAVEGSLAEDGDYFEFYGIPYADSTSGSNRFKEPNPPPSFTETFVANRKDIICVRPLGDGFEGTEDCLVANVFTPSIEITSELPVMVWIKGREFDRVYEHELSFKNFIEKDVVVVSLNFRESVLGFLCLGTENAPGNAGLKDIIAALRWVQQNIAQFGGDPNNVSIFGHGSGAAAVDLITMSPMANGLVHKAISQSGTAIAPWAVTRDNLEFAVQVAEALGHEITNIEDLSEFFTKTSVADLMGAINDLDLTDNSLAFAPCIENESLDHAQPFLTKSPFRTISHGEFLQIPFMTGFVDSEGTIRSEEAIERDWLNRIRTSFIDFLQPDLQFQNEDDRAEVAEEIKNFYFETHEISTTNIEEYILYHGDTMILVSAFREAFMRARASTQNLFVYQFSYKGTLGKPFVGPLEVENAAHSEELAYLFHDNSDSTIPDMDLTVGDILIERWTNFAKYGKPESETSHIEWEPFTLTNPVFLRVLDIDETDDGTLEAIAYDLHSETLLFWQRIYEGHFLDAEGRWDLNDRNEDDVDEVIVVDSFENEDGEPDASVPDSDEDEEDGEPDTSVPDSDEDEEDGEPDTSVPDSDEDEEDGEPDASVPDSNEDEEDGEPDASVPDSDEDEEDGEPDASVPDPDEDGEESVPPLVNIAQGAVEGSLAEDGDYFEFYGIPYADSTSGSNRFKAPNPPPSFADTFVANRKDVICVRPLGVGFEGTEDCLVANVLTPSIESTSQLPVMVWIKGREFDRVYEHELSFKHFIGKDIVVVSLNFRESVLGFLCLGTENAPGNAGLKDIIAGLRWVQQNIAQFGGDPNNVSIFGHGSGAAAVDLITMSPMANGLVHKAISQSGTAIAPWAVTRDNLEFAVQVAEALGHEITNIEDLSELFTRASVATLMAAINDLDLTDNSLAFAPCIENERLEHVQPFLTKSPFRTISDGEFLQIPFMTGFVDSEGTIRSEEAIERDWLNRIRTSFIDFLQPDLQFQNENDKAEIAEQIKNFYFETHEISTTNIEEYILYHSDTMILVSALREAFMRARASTQNLFVYQFSYKGTLGKPFVGPLEVENAAHSEELAYLFHDNSDSTIPDMDLTVGDILIERWTNFAKYGKPESETSHIEWEPFTLTNPVFLRVLDVDEITDGTLEIVVHDPHSETLLFWQHIYEEHFLDAEGRWDLNERDDDDDEVIVVDSFEDKDEEGDEPEVPDVPDPDEDVSEEKDEEDEEDEDDEKDEDDSASTAVGYTFLIISLFTILGQFHWSQLLS